MELIVERNERARKRIPSASPERAAEAFHRSLPGYAPTPLHDARGLACQLGVGRLWLKDESQRLGLPAFKITGASWAVAYALRMRLGLGLAAGVSFDALRTAVAVGARPTLVAATDGNHGRAIAYVARLLGLPARIFVPDDMVAARRDAIASEGAQLVIVKGGYDAAVARSAAAEDSDHVVVSDTSWPGYEDVPSVVIEGYSTVLWEVDDELRRRGAPDPDVVLIPVGVGSFAAAVVRHYKGRGVARPPRLVAVEPTRAACVLASVRAGGPVTIAGPHDSIMSGLNCGTPSPVAWPILLEGIEAFVAIEDEVAREGMRLLAGVGIVGGECAGGVLGAVRALRDHLDLAPDACVLTFLTEGATDPEGYAEIVGRPPEALAAHRHV